MGRWGRDARALVGEVFPYLALVAAVFYLTAVILPADPMTAEEVARAEQQVEEMRASGDEEIAAVSEGRMDRAGTWGADHWSGAHLVVATILSAAGLAALASVRSRGGPREAWSGSGRVMRRRES